MRRPRWIRRCAFSLKLLALLLTTSSVGAELLPLRPFSASYDLYHGGMHIAVTELRLERNGDHWRYSMLTRPRGIFAWFTTKKPYAETTFAITEDDILLHEVLVSDDGRDKSHEAARFDWEGRTLEVMRKGKRKQLQLDGEVYDYQSIHLLAARMRGRQLANSTIDFYRKGRLLKSRFVFSGEVNLNINGQGTGAKVYEQRIVKSRSRVRYYYDAENPLLPLRVERLESGESPAIMEMREVSWDL